jgi:hypothetical protein
MAFRLSSRNRADNERWFCVLRVLDRGLTFDLSGVPKARPLEGRVRAHSHFFLQYLSAMKGCIVLCA